MDKPEAVTVFGFVNRFASNDINLKREIKPPTLQFTLFIYCVDVKIKSA